MDYNPFVGGGFVAPDAEQTGGAPLNTETASVGGGPDRTEVAVAALVLAALGILVLGRFAGFKAVIATRASIGGGS